MISGERSANSQAIPRGGEDANAAIQGAANANVIAISAWRASRFDREIERRTETQVGTTRVAI